jgi:hypothetical protein
VRLEIGKDFYTLKIILICDPRITQIYWFYTKSFVIHKNKIMYVFKYLYIIAFALTNDILLCLETTDGDHHKTFPFIV